MSESLVARRMMPEKANAWGVVFGGEILHQCDEAAGIAATRHARSRSATAGVDAVSFRTPANVGEVLTCKARVNAVFGSSMEIGVRVEAEDLLSGDIKHVGSAYFIFVALDEDGRPRDIGDVEPADDEARRRWSEAHERQAARRGAKKD